VTETVSLGGRPVAGFALGDSVATTPSGTVSPRYAALMTGAAAGLLAHTLRAPLWADVLVGAAAAVATKASIDRAAAA